MKIRFEFRRTTLYTPTKSKDGHEACYCSYSMDVYFEYASLLFTHTRTLTLMCLVAISSSSSFVLYALCCTTSTDDLLSRSRFPFLSVSPIQPTKNGASFALLMFASLLTLFWTLTSTFLCAASAADGAAYWVAAGCRATGKILKCNLRLASTWPKKTMTLIINWVGLYSIYY